jgi:hypothetical protein
MGAQGKISLPKTCSAAKILIVVMTSPANVRFCSERIWEMFRLPSVRRIDRLTSGAGAVFEFDPDRVLLDLHMPH